MRRAVHVARLLAFTAGSLWLGASAPTAMPATAPTPDAAAAANGDVAALASRWSGVFDLTEQIFFDAAPELDQPAGTQQRLQLLVSPATIPWLGPQVLYLQEYAFDTPAAPRRQVLLSLTPGQQPGTVRVQQYTFRRPGAWLEFAERPEAAAELTVADIDAHPGCDLVLVREAEQFRGGTLSRACRDGNSGHYIDYQLLLGEDLYWYRQRTLALRDDELRREVAGFTLIDIEDARLFSCVVSWRDKPGGSTQRLQSLDLHDQGGRGNFTTPDGRSWRITLNGRDGAFSVGHDTLQLLLESVRPARPLARSWAAGGADSIALDYGQLQLQCTPVVADRDDLPT